jgi:hypothetical protein
MNSQAMTVRPSSFKTTCSPRGRLLTCHRRSGWLGSSKLAQLIDTQMTHVSFSSFATCFLCILRITHVLSMIFRFSIKTFSARNGNGYRIRISRSIRYDSLREGQG